MNEGYEVQNHIPESLAIGDNEGCGMVTLLPNASQPGLYLIGMSHIDMAGATYLARNLTELLVEGKNLAFVFRQKR